MPDISQTKPFWTTTAIAEHFGVARHKIEYLVKSRRVEGLGRAGNARLFSGDDVERFGRELQQNHVCRLGRVG